MVDELIVELHDNWTSYTTGESQHSAQHFTSVFTESSQQTGPPTIAELEVMLDCFDGGSECAALLAETVALNYVRRADRRIGSQDELHSLAASYLRSIVAAAESGDLKLPGPLTDRLTKILEADQFSPQDKLVSQAIIASAYGPYTQLPDSDLITSLEQHTEHVIARSADKPAAHALPGLFEAIWGIAPDTRVRLHLTSPIVNSRIDLSAYYQLWRLGGTCIVLPEQAFFGTR